MDIRIKSRLDLFNTINDGLEEWVDEEHLMHLITDWINRWMCELNSSQAFSFEEITRMNKSINLRCMVDEHMKGLIGKTISRNDSFFAKRFINNVVYEQHSYSVFCLRDPAMRIMDGSD